jgi:hypothetical protein
MREALMCASACFALRLRRVSQRTACMAAAREEGQAGARANFEHKKNVEL